MANKGGKSVYLAALALFLGGFGYLLYSGLSENSVYFVNVSEALAVQSQGELGQARIFGAVAPGSIDGRADALGVIFDLADKDNPERLIRVDYAGAVPDTFKPGVEVIVEGRMITGGVFKATTLMTKCPSKYEEMREEEKTAKLG